MIHPAARSRLRRVVWASNSPDGRYRLEISRQATFPAFDILDPEGTAYFVVTDLASQRAVATVEVRLLELFDLQEPVVRFLSSGCRPVRPPTVTLALGVDMKVKRLDLQAHLKVFY